MNRTAIEWTEFTWNPVRARHRETGHVGHYCEKISPACAHCYAAAWNVAQRHKRHDGTPSTCGTGVDFLAKNFDAVDLFLDEGELTAPLRLKRPSLIFPCDMTDLFLDRYHFAWILRVFDVMRQAHWHTFQVLTKRPQRMAKLAPKLDWPANVWAGTTVEDQPRAEERIPWLLQVPAPVRFLSIEPLLGLLDLGSVRLQRSGKTINVLDPSDALIPLSGPKIGLVIVGGESGPGARPMHPGWLRSIRDQCLAAGVPFFFKQWGDWVCLDQSPSCAALRDAGLNPGFCPIGLDGNSASGCSANHAQGEVTVYRFGKQRAGSLLDGVAWKQMPPRLNGVLV